MSPGEDEPFPWHIGVFDAHCHPTDTVASIEQVSSMKCRALTIMATRRQDQHLVVDFAKKLGYVEGTEAKKFVIPSFGFHPWFSHQILDDRDRKVHDLPSTRDHYKQVITPCPEDEEFLVSLPEPQRLSEILHETRELLVQFPYAVVGEIGLDKAFRIPGTELLDPSREADPALTPGSRDGRKLSPYHVDMDHQRKVLTAQLNLAGEMQRAVSVHGVAAHGVVFDTLSATWRGHEKNLGSKRERRGLPMDEATHVDGDYSYSGSAVKPFPPRICLHSYSGAADTVKLYLQPAIPANIFFSFSTLVNFSSSSKKAIESIRTVPHDKILAESDLHAAGQKMDELMEDIVRRICAIKGWSLQHGVKQLESNWRHFIFGLR